MQRIATVAVMVVVAAGILAIVGQMTMVGQASAQLKSGWCYDSRGPHRSIELHCFGNRHACETALQADPRHIETHCFKR